jgi:hypothetical protein
MCRIHQVLKRLERDKVWHLRHGHNRGIERIDGLIAEWQLKYDRLAGVPERDISHR